ncbi:hypothetical protein [Nonomuraea sp. SYSU D8015]|uniref:hypothetical protein n=1 Tax=Nonomuraea sp. SYSU D8015 TaxID=2593644 RepID=UPI001CB74593|nr:hypothetical protein [Nonomuraea sp. SYSU D8015]
MWQTIVAEYGGTGLVYCEPMNEPYAYSDAGWKNLAAQWPASHPGVPRGRVIISGAGYNQRLITIGSDSRFDGTLTSRHIYQFFDTSRTTEESCGRVAAEARALQLGTVYWPGVRPNDWYRLQAINGSGTNLSLSTTNASGRDRLRYSWGWTEGRRPRTTGSPPATAAR